MRETEGRGRERETGREGGGGGLQVNGVKHNILLLIMKLYRERPTLLHQLHSKVGAVGAHEGEHAHHHDEHA